MTIKGEVMGTTYKVILKGAELQTYDKQINNIFEQVNQEMSTYLDTSSISQINNKDLFEWTKVSENFKFVLSFALTLCKDTNGIYDVSVGRLVNTWGFGPYEANNPSTEDNQKMLNDIGCDSVEINQDSVRRMKDVHLDFSSIAKGYAIDLVHNKLISDKEIKSHYIELGGEIRTSSIKESNTPWTVGIEDPEKPSNSIFKLQSNKFKEFAVATSGDYRNVRIFDKQLLSHTIDVDSGKPKKFSKSSVTVVANSAMTADALATALNAMEQKEALRYANLNDINTIFLSHENNKTNLILSNSMLKIVK